MLNEFSHNVLRFNGTTGAFLGVFGSLGAVQHTHGLAVGPGGDLFLGNLAAGTIERFNGVTGAHMGAFSTDPAHLDFTADLAFSLDGNLYVTRDGSGGVNRYDSVTGAFVDNLIPAGASSAYWGVLVEGGFIYLGNKSLGTIKKYTDSGTFVGDFPDTAAGPFDIISMPVPEPGAAVLLVAGGAIFLRLRWRRGAKLSA